MTVNTIALRKKVGGAFLTKKEFEKAIGKSYSFTNRLLNGHVVDSLNLDTIYKIIDVLNLTEKEVLEIFFNKTE